MTTNKIPLPDYNLEYTLLGGQAFNFDFDKNENCYFGFTQDKIIQLKVAKSDDKSPMLYWQTYPENYDKNFIRNYLRLDINYAEILKKIQKDKYIKLAVAKYPNLRLLKQDFDQTLLSFIVSINKNIKSIKNIIRKLCIKFGRKVNVNNKIFCLFPETEKIAEANLEDLLSLGLGFRAKYLKGAANYLLTSKLSSEIYKLREGEARDELRKIYGIGDKIADCILAFSLGFDNVTPLDIWAKRALVKYYKLNPKSNYETMRSWTKNYFNGYAAWAGQFLYEYIRNNR